MKKPIKSGDFSVDCETLDTCYSAALVSFAFVQFDIETGELGETFHREIDLNSAIKSGTISAETLTWWMEQGTTARKVFSPKNKAPLATALHELHQWMFSVAAKSAPAPVRVWAYGPSSDITWLEHAYAEGCIGLTPPWGHRQVRDMRTLIDRAGYLPDNWPIKRDENAKHDALFDACYQAQTIAAAWQQCAPNSARKAQVDEAIAPKQGSIRATAKNVIEKSVQAFAKVDPPKIQINLDDEEL